MKRIGCSHSDGDFDVTAHLDALAVRCAHPRDHLEGCRGEKNRGCGSEVSDLRGDLDANERVEMGNTC